MREYSTPGSPTPDRNITELLYRHEIEHPDSPLLSSFEDGRWEDMAARRVVSRVRALAGGLITEGIEAGDRVALLSRTRLEWTLCDFAILSTGAVTVPIYETSSAEQVQWILADSGARAIFCETVGNAELVGEVRRETPGLENVWCFENHDLDHLDALGSEIRAEEIERRRNLPGNETLASIVYTSGTTGRPKGCCVTHGNCLSDLHAIVPHLQDLFNSDSSTLLFLPLAHIFGRAIQIGCISSRTRMGYCTDTKDLVPMLQSFRPTFVLSVPRVFERVYNSANTTAEKGGRARLFESAERTAIAWSTALQGGKVPFSIEARRALYELLVYRRLRAALGGEVRHAVSSGGPLGARLGHFFRGAGITVLEAYGLTETIAATFNWPGEARIGTVGRPIPGDSVRIADDGEVLLKGPNVFAGYWKNEAATTEAFHGDHDWFKTGDIGELDADGFLSITGRKKELIVTAAGKNVAPAVLEDRLRADNLISQCMVVGDSRPFIACLVTIDSEAWPAWAEDHHKSGSASDHVDDEDLRAAIQEAVDEANKAVSKAESIRKFTILHEDFSEDNGEMTPTLKLKRAVVAKNHAGVIEALYD